MSLKRGAFEQGGKDTGIDTGAEDKASEPVRKATTAQMRARNIKQPRGRLHGTRSATPPNFALQAIGNPFSTADPNTVNNPQANSTNAANKPPNSAFTFGGGNQSTQSFPPSNNIENQQPTFGASSQNNSFPSTQQSNSGSLFGNIAPSAGFTFGNAFNTNNPFAQKPADPPPSNQSTSQPDSSTSSLFNFGKTPEFKQDQNQNPPTQNENFSTEFSQIFQTIPKRDTQDTPKDKNKDEEDMVDFNNTLWQTGNKPGTFGSKGLQRPPPTPMGLARPDPVDPPPTYQYNTSSSPLNPANGANQSASTKSLGKRPAQEAGHYGDGYQAYEDEARGRDPTPRSQINSQTTSQVNGSASAAQKMGFGSASNNLGASSQQGGFGSSSGQGTGFGASNQQNGFGFSTAQQTDFGTSNQQGGSGSSTGQSNGFGASNQQSGFGNSSSQSQGFGTSNQQSGFGASNQQGGFGTPSRQTNGFGNPTPNQQAGFGSSSSAQGNGFGSAAQTNGFGNSNQGAFSSSNQGGTSGHSTQPSLPGLGNWGSSASNNASSMSQSNQQQVANNAQSTPRPSSSAASTGFGSFGGASSQNPFGQTQASSLFGNNNVFGQSQERQQQQPNQAFPQVQSSQNASNRPDSNHQSMSDDRQQSSTMAANAVAEPTSPNHDMHDADGGQRQDDTAQNFFRRRLNSSIPCSWKPGDAPLSGMVQTGESTWERLDRPWNPFSALSPFYCVKFHNGPYSRVSNYMICRDCQMQEMVRNRSRPSTQNGEQQQVLVEMHQQLQGSQQTQQHMQQQLQQFLQAQQQHQAEMQRQQSQMQQQHSQMQQHQDQTHQQHAKLLQQQAQMHQQTQYTQKLLQDLKQSLHQDAPNPGPGVTGSSSNCMSTKTNEYITGANPSTATQQDALQAPTPQSTPHASVQQTSLHFSANQNPTNPQSSAAQSAQQTASQQHAFEPPTSVHHSAPHANATEPPELKALAYIRLKKLNVGLLDHMKLQDTNDDWSEICSAYISQRDKILDTSGIGKSLKRKSDFEDVSPSKRSAIGTHAPAITSTASPAKPQSKTADFIENIVAQPSASNTPMKVTRQASSQAPEQQSSHLFTPQPRRQISQGTDLFSEKLAASTQPSGTPRDGSPRRVLPTPDERRRNSAAEETSNKPNPFAQVQPSRTPTPSSPTKTSTKPFSNESTSTKKQSTIGNAGEEELADYEDSDDDQTLEQEMQRQKNPNPNAGKSLFDRITTPARDNSSEGDLDHGKTTATPRPPFGQNTAATTNLFGTSGATPSNLFGAQPSSGDHTWKGQEHSPINFSTSMNGTPAGATAAASSASKDTTSSAAETRPFGSLFGTPKADTTPSLFGQQSSSRLFQNPTLQPPTATPSLFSGSANASRATTPGMNASGASDAGNDTNDEEAEAPLAQADLTAPSEEELSRDDIIHEVPRVRLMQYRPDKPKDGSPWLVIATGPLRLMKNKSTGSVRVVVRGDLRGNVVLNATLQEGMTFSKKQKCVVSFGAPDTEGVMRGWHVKVGKDDVADHLLGMLQTATPEEL